MSKLQELIETVSFLTGKPRKAVETLTTPLEGASVADGVTASNEGVSADELPENTTLD